MGPSDSNSAFSARSLFFIIFLYALRKVIPWLGRFGTARHWMDFHVIAGVTAPIVIAFHASFKFRGIAGVAFWIMLAVALSGVIGRYLYAQIPRSLTAAELSLTELHLNEQELSDASARTIRLLSGTVESGAARALCRTHRQHRPTARVGEMIVLDVGLPFRVAGLRRTSCGFGDKAQHVWRAALKRECGGRNGGSPREAKSLTFQARGLPRPNAEASFIFGT